MSSGGLVLSSDHCCCPQQTRARSGARKCPPPTAICAVRQAGTGVRVVGRPCCHRQAHRSSCAQTAAPVLRCAHVAQAATGEEATASPAASVRPMIGSVWSRPEVVRRRAAPGRFAHRRRRRSCGAHTCSSRPRRSRWHRVRTGVGVSRATPDVTSPSWPSGCPSNDRRSRGARMSPARCDLHGVGEAMFRVGLCRSVVVPSPAGRWR